MMRGLTPNQRRWAVALLLVLAAALAWVLKVGSPPEGTVETLKLRELVVQMTWKAALLDAALALGLLLTLRWWATEDAAPAADAALPRLSRRAVLLLLCGLGLAAAVRLPRMTLSLYNDEAHNFTRLFCGSWKVQDGVPTLRAVKPFDTMWQNSAGNNSQPYSLLAAGCYTLWLQATGSPRGEVCEWAVRLPALVLGLASLGLLGLLGRRWGGDKMMLWVLLAGALHPWHMRYCTEARGYSGMLLGISLLALGVDAGLRAGRWRDWLVMGSGVLVCAWFFLGSIYFLLGTFAVVLVCQAMRWRKKEVAGVQVLRPLVAGVLAAMLGAPLLLPMLPQLARVLETFESIHGTMGWLWWRDVVSYLCYGCCWQVPGAAGVENVLSVLGLIHDGRLLLLVLVLLAVVEGMIRLGAAGRVQRVVVVVSVLSVLLAWALMTLRGHYLHYWYVLFALPALLLAVAGYGVRNPGISAVVLLFYSSLCFFYMRHGRQDERSAAVVALGGIWPHGKGAATLATIWTNTPIYHPATVVLTRSEELEPLVLAARGAGRPLYVSMAHRGSALATHGDAVRRLEGPEFELLRTFWGQDEEQFTAYLYKLRQ